MRTHLGAALPDLLQVLRVLGEIDRHVQILYLIYRGASLIRNRSPLGPYSRTMPMTLWWP